MAVTVVLSCVSCGRELPAGWMRLSCSECINARAAVEEQRKEAALQDGPLHVAPTPAPAELGEHAEHCKRLGMRVAKGEFVASDGTRMAYEWTFDREQKKGRDDG